MSAAGRNDALLGRVVTLRVSPEGTTVYAGVRGNRPAPYDVEVHLEDTGPRAVCTCSEGGTGPCRHAVATLEALRFPLKATPGQDAVGRRGRSTGRSARGQGRIIQKAPPKPGFVVVGEQDRTLTRDERLELARRSEISERTARARKERATVKLLPYDGAYPRFVVGRRGSGGPYRVSLRGPKGAIGSCTCPDFAQSELGLCKHIERARSWYLRKKKPPMSDVLSVWWQPRVWTTTGPDTLREIRIDAPDERRPGELSRYFDADGWLRGVAAGDDPVVWAERACETARDAALRRGWVWDLDPAVENRLRERRDEAELRDRLADVEDDRLRETSAGLGFRLHPYQEDGFRFLARRGRAFLADDMGLGKTVQAIAASLALRETVGARKALVVCPASLKYQWQSEIRKVCDEHAPVVEGRRSIRAATYSGWQSGFLLINYELVLRDLDLLGAAGADIVILDEAQRIKNWDTKTAKAVKQLRSRYAFILTGTPLENRLVELHSLVEFLHPRALGPRWRLLPYHAVTDPAGMVVAYEDLGVLRDRLRPFFLRRERGAVLDQLPDKTENTFWTGLTAAQMRPYRRYASRIAKLLATGAALGPAEVRTLLQSLTSMRILCNSLAQHAWDRYRDRILGPPAADPSDLDDLQSPKMQEFVHVMEDLLERPGTKIVVFSQWERALLIARYALGNLLARRGERTGVFHGGLSARARDQLLDEFRDDPAFRVLLSTDAGGLGLNLQDAASVVVNLEVPWNPAVLEQRIARVHRLGQRRSVQVLHFVTRRSIEERVRRVVESKRALFEGLLVDDLDRVTFPEGGATGFVEQVRSLLHDS